jgi:xanthine dehydrogenase YagR molybdenum-binding subunit
LNPLLATSQVNGGIIQGVSYALFENRVMDEKTGRMVNTDLESYKILGANDCPEIRVEFMNVSPGWNNTGAVGLGEPPTVPTAAAIANAVENAIGVRVRELPITPERVLAALAGRAPVSGGEPEPLSDPKAR